MYSTEQPITQDNAPPSILNNRVIVYYTRSNAALFWYKFNRKPRANLGQFYSVHSVTYYWTFPAALRQIERELFRVLITRGIFKGTACFCIVSEALEGFCYGLEVEKNLARNILFFILGSCIYNILLLVANL